MKTEIKHEYGNWNVYVNGDPKFSFTYRKEAESVRDMIEALIISQDCFSYMNNNDAYGALAEELTQVESVLKKIGAL